MHKPLLAVEHRETAVRRKDHFRERELFLIVFNVLTAALFKAAEHHSEIVTYRHAQVFYGLYSVKHRNARTFVIYRSSAVKHIVFYGQFKRRITPALTRRHRVQMREHRKHRLTVSIVAVHSVTVSVERFHPEVFEELLAPFESLCRAFSERLDLAFERSNAVDSDYLRKACKYLVHIFIKVFFKSLFVFKHQLSLFSVCR